MRIRLSPLPTVFAALLTVVLAGGVLAGCGGSTDNSAPPDGNAQTGETVDPQGSLPPLPPSGRVSLPPTPTGKETAVPMTLTGRPTEGVENGCIVMESGGKLYNLLGGDRQMLQSGRTVVVKGTPNPGLMTTCQQGTPFQVTEVSPA
jgi:hypothetical protein